MLSFLTQKSSVLLSVRPGLIPLCRVFVLLGWCVSGGDGLAQSAYDEQPLRANVADVPFANTSLGREKFRFAGDEINRYRIFGFYKRQAQWHLENPGEKPALLLPFTGLDGGRRGHWGVTNELSAQALKRSMPPAFPDLLARGEYGLHYLSYPEVAGVVVYDFRKPGVRKVLAEASLKSPPGPFRGAVDCWGFSVQAVGREWGAMEQAGWTSSGRALAFRGYQVGDRGRIIYRHAAGDGGLLEQVSLTKSETGLVLTRGFRVAGTWPELSFFAGGGKAVGGNAAGEFIFPAEEGKMLHRVAVSPGTESVLSDDGKMLVLRQPQAGASVTVTTWKPAAPGQDFSLIGQPGISVPPAVPAAGLARYAAELTTSGILNADPAASGTAYEIDDIGIPFENPWHTPMTFTGIDFDAQGIAYLCTIVGDVWRVEGLDGGLGKVSWRRFASGLNLPMGLVVVDGIPFVSCRRQVMKLQDRNRDGEADDYGVFNQQDIPQGGENGGDIRRDAAGNFYINGSRGIYRISPDGSTVTQVGSGSRNPLGLAVREDGLVLSDSSEGDSGNGTCTVFESNHPENAGTVSLKKRILYLPRGIDASPGSRIFMTDARFGPLGNALLGLSYSNGSWYQILRDPNEGTPQAALQVMPGAFASGSMRWARNPVDGQLYTVGMDGWGDYAVQESCFHRIRYTGRTLLLPVSWQAHRNGLLVRFNGPVEAASLRPESFFAQQWNTVDYQHTYGSADYSVRQPEKIGHDRIVVSSVAVQPDGCSVFFGMPELRPAMYTQLYGHLTGSTELDLYATINRLRPDFPGGPEPVPQKPDVLTVRQEEQGGNTYEVLMGFFDKAAGRDAVTRPVAEPALGPEALDYEKVKTGVIDRYCIACHMAGTPHELSTYESLVRKVVPGNAGKSHMIGLLKTRSMPPFPLPALHPTDVAALERWVNGGAPKTKSEK